MSIRNEIKKTEKLMHQIASGKMLNAMVESAIYQKAIGFMTTEEKIIENKDGVKEKITITKEEPPDLKSALAWLYNRCPEKWNENQDNSETLNKVANLLQELDNIINDE